MYIESIPSRGDLSNDVQARIFFVDDESEVHWIEKWSLDSVIRPRSLRRAQVHGQLGFDFQGFYITMPILLMPGNDHRRMYFRGMDSRQQDLLKLFYRGIRSGDMVQTDDVIRALDTPVDRVPMNETEEELRQSGASGVARRAARGMVTLCIYTLLAVLVFGTIAYSAWSRWNFVEMANARVVATEGGQAVQGWLHDDDVTETWVGMPADIQVNLGGNVVSVPARVSAMQAGSEAGFMADEGYLVQIVPEEGGFEGESVPVGTPVKVVLDRQLVGEPLSLIGWN